MEQLKLKMPPTKKEICMMCHFSSECGECCIKCNNRCNSKQRCGLRDEEDKYQTDRLESWLYIINSHSEFNHLKRFIK